MFTRNGIVALSFVCIAWLVAQEPAAKFEGPKPAILRGRVTDPQGAPIAGVRVRVAIPAADMRFVDATTGQKLLETTSDDKGDYRLEVVGVEKPTIVSMDAMKPGFQRLVGTLMAGGDARRIEVTPGKVSEADLRLELGRYAGGIVSDEKGIPISGVKISGNVQFGDGTGGVEVTASNTDGSFAIFGFPVDPKALGDQPIRGVVYFTHPDYIDLKFVDVYTLNKELLKDLRIVLETGHKVSGTVLDTNGKTVGHAVVKVKVDAEGQQKGTETDAEGKFAIGGLGGGGATLDARAYPIKQKLRMPIDLDGDKIGLEVRLRPMVLPADPKTFDVLGMRLADITPELKSAYDLYWDRGALILDPGKDFDRLKIGELAEGFAFWMVGQTRVESVRDFVGQILAETAGRDAEIYSIRVVYSFRTSDSEGSNTQYLKLTRDDLKQLRTLSDKMKAEKP